MTNKNYSRRLDEILVESKIPGGTGLDAHKLTVKLWGKGVFRSSAKRAGSEATSYFIRRSGQLIFSKLDFLNGAIGVIPSDLDGFQSTTDLPSFDVHSDFDPQYICNFLRRKTFYNSLRGSARGGRKAKRVALKQLASIEIPAVSPERQSISIELYKSFIHGIGISDLLIKKYENLIVERRSEFFSHFVISNCPVGELSDLVEEVKEPVLPERDKIYREIGVRSHGRGIFLKENVTSIDVGNKRVFRVKSGCIVFNVVFAWEGAVALTGDEHVSFIASHRFPQYKLRKDAPVTLAYLKEYFESQFGLSELERVSPGGAGRNKTLNKSKLLKIKIPLPDSNQIYKFVTEIDSLRNGIELLKLFQEKLINLDESSNERFFREI
ncbi:MAG: restriction endonuclease subunit S [Proteobacteria bacterium]|nr:MAG: restriction endonuclease subunit S [Pseudomonadota bacterium]